MKVYDLFLFFYETDLLDIRMAELDGVVDEFVLIESPYTFTRQPKPLYYKESGRCDPKVKHIVVEMLPEVLNMKSRNIHLIEKYQRNFITKYLVTNCKDDDVIIFSDIDEIPRREMVEQFIRSKKRASRFVTRLYRYYYNLYFQDWKCSHMFRWIKMKEFFLNFDSIRKYEPPILKGDMGWHFSSVGTFEEIWKKLENKSSANEPRVKSKLNKENIKNRIRQRMHPFKEKSPGIIHSIELMPKFIQDNRERFQGQLL